MADFRTKLITLAGVATMFAGMAYGQATVGAAGAATSFVNAEDQTATLPTLTIPITNSTAIAATGNVSIFLSPTVSITSLSTTGAGAHSEIQASAAGTAGCGVAPTGTAIYGTVSGNSVTFSGVDLGTGGAGCVATISVSFIRINATQIASSNGIPGSVSATSFVTGLNVTPGTTSAVTLAYVTPGLAAAKSTVTTGFVTSTCAAVAPETGAAITPAFTLTIAETYAGAFKLAANVASTSVSGAAVVTGTRIAITLTNIPTNVSVYFPQTVTTTTATGTSKLTAIKANTAAAFGTLGTTALAGLDPGGVNTWQAGEFAATIANNSTTVYYEYTTNQDTVVDSFSVPVALYSAAAAVPQASTAITAAVSLATLGAGTAPNLTSSSATSGLAANAYTACSTTLLFPYVTNVAGFETGIAISNTSLDSIGAKGVSSVATQNGTCALTFFGNSPASTNPAAATTGSVSGGTSATFTLTSVAGAGFTGYMIANCNFQYAHGFTYIVSGFGTSNGVAMGYVANPLGATRGLVAPEQLEN